MNSQLRADIVQDSISFIVGLQKHQSRKLSITFRHGISLATKTGNTHFSHLMVAPLMPPCYVWSMDSMHEVHIYNIRCLS